MLIGYARVSTNEQNLDLQRDALHKVGCEQIYTDAVSGTKARRPGLEEALSHLRAGDTLVVWRLDRLGRSLRHLIDTVTDLQEREIGFKSLTESIDTTTSGGKLVFHIFGALAEFEREIIRERTNAGLYSAWARGRKGGRRTALSARQLQIARQLYDARTPVKEICQTLGISRATFYRYMQTNQKDQSFEEKVL
jgi:DNA invertase Pin-like site-specific DNA recombinase